MEKAVKDAVFSEALLYPTMIYEDLLFHLSQRMNCNFVLS